jgi:hypothetical protein
MTRRQACLALMALAVALRIFFWLYSHRTWEDALITVLHSENFHQGLGLTHYRVDETRPVHGFTSPLSVLIPLLGDWFHIGFGLTLLKLVSIPAGAAAVWYACRILQDAPLHAAVLAGGYLAIEHHQILWGMAGMETQIATAILLASICYALERAPVKLGIALGLCLLARPDFAIWALIVGVWLAWDRKWRILAVAAGVACLIYAPWIAFTTAYYGSPIPNTVLAKSIGYGLWWQAPMPALDWWKRLWETITVTIFAPLGPSFGGHGSGFRPLLLGGWIAVAMLMMAATRLRRDAVAALVAVYTLYYVFAVPIVFGWYTAPLAAAMILLCARASPGWIVTGLYLALLAVYLPVTFTAERNIQRIVEDGVRVEMGKYLGQVAGPRQIIACEPLGYTSYYSRRTIWDFPGLASRTVVDRLRRNKGRGLIAVLEMRPDFIVLRGSEYEAFTQRDDGRFLAGEYAPIRRFTAPEAERRTLLFPEANIDTDFLVLKKK